MKPSSTALMAGVTIHTSVVTPAITKFFRRVLRQASAKAGSSHASYNSLPFDAGSERLWKNLLQLGHQWTLDIGLLARGENHRPVPLANFAKMITFR